MLLRLFFDLRFFKFMINFSYKNNFIQYQNIILTHSQFKVILHKSQIIRNNCNKFNIILKSQFLKIV